MLPPSSLTNSTATTAEDVAALGTGEIFGIVFGTVLVSLILIALLCAGYVCCLFIHQLHIFICRLFYAWKHHSKKVKESADLGRKIRYVGRSADSIQQELPKAPVAKDKVKEDAKPAKPEKEKSKTCAEEPPVSVQQAAPEVSKEPALPPDLLAKKEELESKLAYAERRLKQLNAASQAPAPVPKPVAKKHKRFDSSTEGRHRDSLVDILNEAKYNPLQPHYQSLLRLRIITQPIADQMEK